MMDTLSNENISGVNREGRHPNFPLKYLTASSIIGDKVHNNQEEDLGTIEDIMVDVTSGKIEYVVIKYGGFITIGEKYFAVPFGKLKVNPEKKMFTLDQSKEMVEKAPGFDLNHWPETNFHAEDSYWSFL